MPKRKNYDAMDLQRAISDIKSKRLTYGQASKENNIPKTTLHDSLHNKWKSNMHGASRMLTNEEESALVTYIEYVAVRGFPASRTLLKNLVVGIIKDSGRQTLMNLEKGPSPEWCRKFISRHPQLAEKTPESQDKGRARMSNETVMNQYFELLTSTTKELGIEDKPSQIYNCDESGFSGKEKSREKVLAIKGRHAYQQTNISNSHVTLHLCICADGRVLPSFVIFKGGLPHNKFNDGVPSSWLFGSSESGYMDGDLFELWFTTTFIPNCGIRRPVLLILDNHESHITLPVLKAAIANNIVLLAMPPHTTHILQPLDVSIFGPLKEKVSSLAAATGYLSSTAIIGKAKFPELLMYNFFGLYDRLYNSSDLHNYKRSSS